VPKEQAQRGFIDDPGTGEQQQAGLNKRGKVFDLAVAVLVVGVSGFVGNSDRPECAASDKMPRLPVLNPTTTFSPVITSATSTELPAAPRFSERIKSADERAGLPDMQELSPLRAESAMRNN
jgi:hypothetical protein